MSQFVSTDGPSSHELASQFGPAIFLYAKNTQKLARKPSHTQVSVEWTSEWPGHGQSIASEQPERQQHERR